MNEQQQEEMDVFARALQFLYKSALENAGFTAEIKVTKIPEPEKDSA